MMSLHRAESQGAPVQTVPAMSLPSSPLGGHTVTPGAWPCCPCLLLRPPPPQHHVPVMPGLGSYPRQFSGVWNHWSGGLSCGRENAHV